MQVIILLFLIAFAWYLSGLMADNYALKKRIRELEKEIQRYKDDTVTTYFIKNNVHNYVAFHHGYVLITELDNEGINKQKKLSNVEFANYANKNNLDFYDWEI